MGDFGIGVGPSFSRGVCMWPSLVKVVVEKKKKEEEEDDIVWGRAYLHTRLVREPISLCWVFLFLFFFFCAFSLRTTIAEKEKKEERED